MFRNPIQGRCTMKNTIRKEADARLYASAPDLLEAAKAAWDAIDNLLDLRRERKADTGDAHEAIIDAHGLLGAAIAKAERQQSDSQA